MVEGHQVKDLEVSSGRDQRAIKIIGHSIQIIDCAEVFTQRALHTGFQALVLGLEDGFSF